jgi:hypothetical protein
MVQSSWPCRSSIASAVRQMRSQTPRPVATFGRWLAHGCGQLRHMLGREHVVRGGATGVTPVFFRSSHAR